MIPLRKKIGKIALAVGIASLAGGLLLAVTVGTVMVQVLLFSSILANSAGILLLRSGGK